MNFKTDKQERKGPTKNISSRKATEPGRLEIPLTGVVDEVYGVRKVSFSKKNEEGD